MSALALLVCACALGAAGCGSAFEREVGSQTHAPPDPKLVRPGHGTAPPPVVPKMVAVTDAVKAKLEGGAIAVVGVEGVAGVRPTTLDVAADQTISGLRWSRWGTGGARGTGTLRTLDCDPTCAQGSLSTEPAMVELSAPASCPQGRFFSRAAVRPQSGRAPASYVRAPC